MSIIVEFAVPTEEFALGRVFDELPSARVELDRVVPVTDAIMPFFWVQDADPEAVTAVLDADERVRNVRVLDVFADRALYRVEWTQEINGLVRRFADHDAAIVAARGTAARWLFTVRFPDKEAVSSFQTACLRAGLSLDVRRVVEPVEPEAGSIAASLTPAQREVLVAALDEGYFSIPRETTLVDLAADLGVSDQAVSERLRRGQATLLRSAGLLDAEDSA